MKKYLKIFIPSSYSTSDTYKFKHELGSIIGHSTIEIIRVTDSEELDGIEVYLSIHDYLTVEADVTEFFNNNNISIINF